MDLCGGFGSSRAVTAAAASEDCSGQQEAVQRSEGLAEACGFLREHNLAPGASPAVQCGLVQAT